MKTFINGYKQLANKEKKALIVCAVAIIFFAIYQFAYRPFESMIKKLQIQVHYQSELNQWFKDIQPKIKNTVPLNTFSDINPDQLLSITADELNVILGTLPYELGQSDSNSVLLTIKEIDYQTFMRWLEPFFRKKPQLLIKELTINASKHPGMVSVSLKF